MKIFLDDIRNPIDCLPYMHHRIGSLNPIYLEEWVVVRCFQDFVSAIRLASKNGIAITHISFDHDLADDHYAIDFEDWLHHTSDDLLVEQTGYDAAKWLKEYYAIKNLPLPTIFVHSMNPVGREKIQSLFGFNK